ANGLRVAWTPDFCGLHPVEPAVLDVLRANVRLFASPGAEGTALSPDLSGAIDPFRSLRVLHFQHNLAALIDAHQQSVKPSVVANAQVGRDLTGRDVAAAEAHHGVLFDRMHRFFGEYDVLLAPVSQAPPFDVELEYPDQ